VGKAFDIIRWWRICWEDWLKFKEEQTEKAKEETKPVRDSKQK
jgi:hypothetical protein